MYTITLTGPAATERQALDALAAAGYTVLSAPDVRAGTITVVGHDPNHAAETVTPFGWRLTMHAKTVTDAVVIAGSTN